MREDGELVSSLLDGFSYDDESGNLRLYLKNGEFRDFGAVPKTVVQSLKAAKSPGGYYMSNIRGIYSSP